jgi:hypothetical protein
MSVSSFRGCGAISIRWIGEVGMSKPPPRSRPSFGEAFVQALAEFLSNMLLLGLAGWLAWFALTWLLKILWHALF